MKFLTTIPILALLIGSAIFPLSSSAQQAVAIAPGAMSPVGQYLTDHGINFMYIADTSGVFVTIFTEDKSMAAAAKCEALTKIGPITKVTIRYEVDDEKSTTIVVGRDGSGNLTIRDGSVDSAVCN